MPMTDQDRTAIKGVLASPGFWSKPLDQQRQALKSVPYFKSVPDKDVDSLVSGFSPEFKAHFTSQQTPAPAPTGDLKAGTAEGVVGKVIDAATRPVTSYIPGMEGKSVSEHLREGEDSYATGSAGKRIEKAIDDAGDIAAADPGLAWFQMQYNPELRRASSRALSEGVGVLESFASPLGAATAGLGAGLLAKGGKWANMAGRAANAMFTGNAVMGAGKSMVDFIKDPSAANAVSILARSGLAAGMLGKNKVDSESGTEAVRTVKQAHALAKQSGIAFDDLPDTAKAALLKQASGEVKSGAKGTEPKTVMGKARAEKDAAAAKKTETKNQQATQKTDSAAKAKASIDASDHPKVARSLSHDELDAKIASLHADVKQQERWSRQNEIARTANAERQVQLKKAEEEFDKAEALGKDVDKAREKVKGLQNAIEHSQKVIDRNKKQIAALNEHASPDVLAHYTKERDARFAQATGKPPTPPPPSRKVYHPVTRVADTSAEVYANPQIPKAIEAPRKALPAPEEKTKAPEPKQTAPAETPKKSPDASRETSPGAETPKPVAVAAPVKAPEPKAKPVIEAKKPDVPAKEEPAPAKRAEAPKPNAVTPPVKAPETKTSAPPVSETAKEIEKLRAENAKLRGESETKPAAAETKTVPSKTKPTKPEDMKSDPVPARKVVAPPLKLGKKLDPIVKRKPAPPKLEELETKADKEAALKAEEAPESEWSEDRRREAHQRIHDAAAEALGITDDEGKPVELKSRFAGKKGGPETQDTHVEGVRIGQGEVIHRIDNKADDQQIQVARYGKKYAVQVQDRGDMSYGKAFVFDSEKAARDYADQIAKEEGLDPKPKPESEEKPVEADPKKADKAKPAEDDIDEEIDESKLTPEQKKELDAADAKFSRSVDKLDKLVKESARKKLDLDLEKRPGESDADHRKRAQKILTDELLRVAKKGTPEEIEAVKKRLAEFSGG